MSGQASKRTTCPACAGAKTFCAKCWRPINNGNCKKCVPGDSCRTCGGTGDLDPRQAALEV